MVDLEEYREHFKYTKSVEFGEAIIREVTRLRELVAMRKECAELFEKRYYQGTTPKELEREKDLRTKIAKLEESNGQD